MAGGGCDLPVTLRLRDWRDPRYRKNTPAQHKATMRNFHIFRLRGLWTQCYMLTGWRKKLACFAIDMQLRRMGAEPQGKRHKKKMAEWANELKGLK